MKSWGEGQVSWRLLNIKDELEEAYWSELELRGPYEGYGNISWGMWMDFYHSIIFLSIVESTSLSIARWVLTYPASEPISREWDSHPICMWERKKWNIIWILMDCFYCIYYFSTVRDPSLLQFSQSPLQYSHISLWWRNCGNGGCAPLSPVDSQEWKNYLYLCNIY